MRMTWTVVVAVLVAALAVQATDLEDKVAAVIDDLREVMLTGREDINIPVLDPLVIEALPLKVNQGPLKADVVASDISVTGVSGFKVTELSQVDGTNKVTVAVEVPAVDVVGKYDINGKIKIALVTVPLKNHGPLKISLRGLKGSGMADIIDNGDGSLNVKNIKINDWKFDKLTIKLEKIVMESAVNKIINSVVPKFIKSNKAKINALAETVGALFLNYYLDAVAGKESKWEEIAVAEPMQWVVVDEVREMLDELALMAVAAPSALRARSSLEEKAAKVLESFKEVMKTGRPDYQIPVLDPALVRQLPLDVNHGPFKAKIIAKDTLLSGISEYVVNKISQVDTNKVVVDISIPAFDITGQFDMKGKVKVFLVSYPINDHGPMKITVKGVQMTATADVRVNDDGSYNLNEVKINSWTVADLSVQLDNLLGGGFIGQQANKLFNQIFPVLVERDRSKINAWLEMVIEGTGNQYLNGLAGKNTANIVEKLLEDSEAFRAAMKKGRPDLNIPVMDPAAINQLTVKVKRWPLTAELVASNIKLAGASEFKLGKISQIVGTDKVAVEVDVPSVDLTCLYDLKSLVKMGFIQFKYNRQGPVKLLIKGLKGVATAELTLDSENNLSLNGLQVESWSYETIEVEMENLMNGGFFKKTILNLINKLIPTLVVNPRMEEVRLWASKAGLRVIGKFLDAVAGRVVVANLDQRAAQLLTDLQGVMKTGSDAYSMPVLDPARVDKVPLSFQSTLLNADLVVKDIKVTGTSEYKITKITQIEGTNRLSVELEVDAIYAYGNFDGSLKVPLLPAVTDSGSVSVVIKTLTNTASATLVQDINGNLLLKDLTIESWNYKSTKAQFANLVNGGPAGVALNKAINVVLPTIITNKKPLLTSWAQQTATSVIDQYLKGVAAQSSTPSVLQLTHITPEAMEVLKQIVFLAQRSGLAEAA